MRPHRRSRRLDASGQHRPAVTAGFLGLGVSAQPSLALPPVRWPKATAPERAAALTRRPSACGRGAGSPHSMECALNSCASCGTPRSVAALPAGDGLHPHVEGGRR